MPTQLPEVVVTAPKLRRKQKKDTFNLVNYLKGKSKELSDFYQGFQNSLWGTAYDVANLGLYAAAPFTAGATLPAAVAMSVGQGALGANDMLNNGVNLNNSLDVIGAILSRPASAASKELMKLVGKNTKIVKHSTTFIPKTDKIQVGSFNLGKHYPAAWQLPFRDIKYLPYASYVYGNLGVNTGQVANDIHDNIKNKK